jgi:hypothetical protein
MNTLTKQFSDALKREGKTITGYYNYLNYTCIFRKNKNPNSENEYLTIFYETDTIIEQGQILTYGGKNYLVLNQESVENDIYFRSDLKECNTRLLVGINGIGHYVPCFSSDLKSPLPNVGQVITTLDGNIELMTEDNEISRNILINNEYIFMGGTYQVINKLIKSGIYYFYMQRITTAEPVYTLNASTDLDTYSVDDTVQISISPLVDGISDPEATITCTSSDTSIATVTNKGLITCIDDGSVTITVTWLETNLTKTVMLTVKDNAPPVYIVTITGDWTDYEQIVGIEYTFSATIKDNLGNPVTPYNLVYSTGNYEVAGMASEVVLIDNHDGTGKMTFGDFDNLDYLGRTFDLICSDTLSGFTGKVTLTVVGLF